MGRMSAGRKFNHSECLTIAINFWPSFLPPPIPSRPIARWIIHTCTASSTSSTFGYAFLLPRQESEGYSPVLSPLTIAMMIIIMHVHIIASAGSASAAKSLISRSPEKVREEREREKTIRRVQKVGSIIGKWIGEKRGERGGRERERRSKIEVKKKDETMVTITPNQGSDNSLGLFTDQESGKM